MLYVQVSILTARNTQIWGKAFIYDLRQLLRVCSARYVITLIYFSFQQSRHAL